MIQDTADIAANGVRGDFFCNGHGAVYPIEIEETLYAMLCWNVTHAIAAL